jgi:hypothetical protein
MANGRRLRFIAVAVVLLSSLTRPVFTQVSSGEGSIEGVVRDPSGGAVPNARISVKNVGTGISRSTISDHEGRYTVLSLPIGDYEVRVEASGFQAIVRSGVTLTIGRTALIDFSLQVGQVTETLSVNSAPPLIEATNATIGEVIQNQEVLALPLNGRSYTQLAALVPQVVFGGVSVGTTVQNNSIGANGSFSISGSRPEGNEFSFNGINVTNEFTGGTFAFPPIDSIQEFKIVQNNYSAEFGGRAGQVILTSKGGSNAFHGSAYEFIRNDNLDANNFFNNLAGLHRQPLKQNQFGASLGGPVDLPHYSGKNRTFFFVNYEGARIRSGTTNTATVPTAQMLTGDFSQLSKVIRDPLTGSPFPGNVIPSIRFSPISENIIRLTQYPLPNVNSIANNYITSPSASTDLNEVSLRVDHNISDNDKLWGSFFWDRVPTTSPRFTLINSNAASVTTQSYTVNETHLFRPTLISDFKAGFNFVSQFIQNESPQNLTDAALGFPQNANQPQAAGVSAGIPYFNPSGYGQLGASTSSPELFKTRHYEIGDTMNWIKGGHVFKFGVDITREHEDQRFNPQIRGNYSFGGTYSGDGFADFLLGLPSSAVREILGPGENIFESLHRGTHYYFFAQDDWKVTPNLTLNLGFRYEFNSPVVEARDRQANYLPKIVDGVGEIVRITAPDPQFGRCLCVSAKHDFGPRFGLAYRPAGSEKTVIRSGYGIFYDYVPYNTKQTLAFNKPWIDRQTITNTVPTPAFDLANSFLPAVLVSAFAGFANDLNYLDAMVQQWNFDIQREIRKSVVVDVGYVGSLAVHLDDNPSLNAAQPGPGPLLSRRPFPNQPVIVFAGNASTATYHAATIKVKKDFSQGLTFLAHYTESKSIDNASSQLSDFQDANNIRANKGLSGFNVPRRFVASVLYELPFGKGKPYLSSAGRFTNTLLGGWMVTGIYTWQSGFWFTPTTSQNTAGTESGTLRPNRLGNGNLSDSQRTRLRWFDTSAFAQPAPFQYGSAGRNILEGPGLKDFDLGLLKNSQIGERSSVQFRAEFFNTFNNTNFGIPNANIAASNFGTISSSGPSRQIQFGLKYLF